ncbi:MAG TPA: hypothetical protein VEC12_02870 [Bacteroidia bacterium]|nr:hypothetical protein [Bacteroidia bacterium]
MGRLILFVLTDNEVPIIIFASSLILLLLFLVFRKKKVEVKETQKPIITAQPIPEMTFSGTEIYTDNSAADSNSSEFGGGDFGGGGAGGDW